MRIYVCADEGGLGGGGMPPGLIPNHKASIVMFLDRVYGIEDQCTFYRLIDEAFLPDLRAATTLDMVSHYHHYYHYQMLLFIIIIIVFCQIHHDFH